MPNLRELYTEMMVHKEIDHNAAHTEWGNQLAHVTSSIMMIGVYCLLLSGHYTIAAKTTCAAMCIRQGGHFFIEGNASHKEVKKIGYNTSMKQIAVYVIFPIIFALWYKFGEQLPIRFENGWLLAFNIYASLIGFHVTRLSFKGPHNFLGLIWLAKIVTDVFTDIPLYGPSVWGRTTPKTYDWTEPENKQSRQRKHQRGKNRKNK